MPETQALHGRVAWFNNAKGYGFLTPDQGPDVFVHYTSIQVDGYKSLQPGAEVMFYIAQGPKGPQADRVAIVQPAREHSPIAPLLVSSVQHVTPA